MTLALSFLLALVVSLALVGACRAIALRLGYLAQPAGLVPSAKPKALFGGVAVAVTLFATAAALGVFWAVPVLAVCSIGILILGVASDLFPQKPSTTLVALIAIASAFVAVDARLHWADSVTLDSVLTVAWVVGIIAAFRLLDNMDGLSGGIALIAGAAFLMTVMPLPAGSERELQAQYLVILLGAVAGFLAYNVHPASVALGETGSLLIGLNMAAMTLQVAPGRGSDLLSIVAVPVLVLLVPIVDAAVAAGSKWLTGESGPSSHRLVAMGLSERTAVGALWLLAGVSGLIAVVAQRGDRGVTGLVAALFVIGIAMFAVYLARVRVHEDVDPDRPTGSIVPLGIDFGYRRRLAEVLLDFLLVSVAYYGAYRLRFDDRYLFAEHFPFFAQSYAVVLGTQMMALLAVGAYRGMWRYFSLSDGLTFVKGVGLGVAASLVAIRVLFPAGGYPPSIFVLDGMLLLLLTVGSRASFRLAGEFTQRRRRAGRRLVVYGAGDAGSIAVRSLLHDSRSAYRILGFIDDDAKMRNVRVHGYRVIGGYDHLVGMIVAHEVDVIAVTQDDVATDGLTSLCGKYGVTLYRVGFDWMEIPLAAPMVSGGRTRGAEGRVVRFDRATPSVRSEPLASPSAPSSPALKVLPSGDANRPLRVVHIITRLILGGAQENTLYTVIGQHQDPRFDVTLLCGIDEAGEGNMFAQADRAGVRITVMPSLLREIRPLTDLKAVFDLYRFLKRGSYDIVHTHSSKAGVVGRIAARMAGVPVVVHTIHGLAFHEYQSKWKNALYVALERLCAPLTHKVVSVSSKVGQAAIDRGIGRPDQHMTIFSGIELDLFLNVRDRLSVAEAKRQAGIPPDALVVGKIARLFELKGHEQFLAAAVEIAAQVPGVHFLFVGDGPLRDQLREEAAALGIGDRLVMVGRVPPERVPEFIQAMDVVVHTSLREGIARVLPQAGAVGKPVVTFELDGAPEVIRDGISGYLVKPVDTSAIAARTVELLRDPGLRDAFGAAGRAFAAEHFSVERMVERISRLYVDLLAGVTAR